MYDMIQWKILILFGVLKVLRSPLLEVTYQRQFLVLILSNIVKVTS